MALTCKQNNDGNLHLFLGYITALSPHQLHIISEISDEVMLISTKLSRVHSAGLSDVREAS
jgi:hypothetical protein